MILLNKYNEKMSFSQSTSSKFKAIVCIIHKFLHILDHHRADMYEVNIHIQFYLLSINCIYKKEVRLWKNPRERERCDFKEIFLDLIF